MTDAESSHLQEDWVYTSLNWSGEVPIPTNEQQQGLDLAEHRLCDKGSHSRYVYYYYASSTAKHPSGEV